LAVAHQTDDFHGDLGLGGRVLAAEALPHRIVAEPELARERLIHDGDARCGRRVTGLEVAAGEQWHAHRLQIAATHPVEIYFQLAGGFVAIYPHAVAGAAATQWWDLHFGRAIDAGQSAQLIQKLLLEGDAPVGRYLRAAEIDIGQEDAVLLKAR